MEEDFINFRKNLERKWAFSLKQYLEKYKNWRGSFFNEIFIANKTNYRRRDIVTFLLLLLLFYREKIKLGGKEDFSIKRLCISHWKPILYNFVKSLFFYNFSPRKLQDEVLWSFFGNVCFVDELEEPHGGSRTMKEAEWVKREKKSPTFSYFILFNRKIWPFVTIPSAFSSKDRPRSTIMVAICSGSCCLFIYLDACTRFNNKRHDFEYFLRID